jgi:hypothetical protein
MIDSISFRSIPFHATRRYQLPHVAIIYLVHLLTMEYSQRNHRLYQFLRFAKCVLFAGLPDWTYYIEYHRTIFVSETCAH